MKYCDFLKSVLMQSRMANSSVVDYCMVSAWDGCFLTQLCAQ